MIKGFSPHDCKIFVGYNLLTTPNIRPQTWFNVLCIWKPTANSANALGFHRHWDLITDKPCVYSHHSEHTTSQKIGIYIFKFSFLSSLNYFWSKGFCINAWNQTKNKLRLHMNSKNKTKLHYKSTYCWEKLAVGCDVL